MTVEEELATLRLVMKEQMDSLTQQVAALAIEVQTIRTKTNTGKGFDDSGAAIPRSMRLDVPKFKGTDPESWIFAMEEYFGLHGTSSEQRLQIVGFNLEGEAAEWFMWMKRNQLITTWEAFLTSVRDRFGPSKYEDARGTLSKLLQLSTVAQYQADFERLMNRVTDIGEGLLISFYISGLKPSLQRELLLAKPPTLGEAFALARISEARLADQLAAGEQVKDWGGTSTTSPTQQVSMTSSNTAASGMITDTPLLPTPNTKSTSPLKLPIKWLSPEERQERLNQGLCFNCDQKYTRGHNCPGKFLLLMTGEEAHA